MEMKTCPHCGAVADEKAQFCTFCGVELTSPVEQEPVTPPQYTDQPPVPPGEPTQTGSVPPVPPYTRPGAVPPPPYSSVPGGQPPYQPPRFCKQCGANLVPGARVCIQCGVPVGSGAGYCPQCGKQIHPLAVMCVHCGAPVSARAAGAKSRLAAGLLGIFLGSLGIHNFYLGNTGKALAQVLASVLGAFLIFPPIAMGIWGLVEGILILTGSINTDARGIPLYD